MRYEVQWLRPDYPEELLTCHDELEVLANRLRAAIRLNGSITVVSLNRIKEPCACDCGCKKAKGHVGNCKGE